MEYEKVLQNFAKVLFRNIVKFRAISRKHIQPFNSPFSIETSNVLGTTCQVLFMRTTATFKFRFKNGHLRRRGIRRMSSSEIGRLQNGPSENGRSEIGRSVIGTGHPNLMRSSL
jgi:hypothetical protein